MTREIVIVAWCDLCPPEAPSKGLSHTVALDGAPPLDVDLCEQHETAAGIDVLAKVLAEHGRPVGGPTGPKRAARPASPGVRLGRPPRGGRPLLCPFCPMDYAHPNSLRAHAEQVHGLKGATLTQTLGSRCALCGRSIGAYLPSHSAKEHGLDVGRAWRQALADGDPHGVCTPIERRAKAVSR